MLSRFASTQRATLGIMRMSTRAIPQAPKLFQSYINGEYLETSSIIEKHPVINPATGTLLAESQIAGQLEVDRAVKCAAEGQKVWSEYSSMERSRILKKAADLLAERNDELSIMECLDTGRPIQETDVVDIVSARDCIDFYAGLAPTISGRYVPLSGGSFGYTIREPLGVIGGIGAWNYPIQGAAWKSAPALACGNSMIFKPAEDTPWTALKLAEIYSEAGVPAGVFNVILGKGDTGQMLSKHDDIAKITFTGEVGTGKRIIKDASDTLKRITMELGGKSPLIIFADTDLDNAVSAAMMANWYSAGEVCSNGTRVFVEESIVEAFTQKLVERTAKLKIGDPLDPQTQIGAVIHQKHRDQILKYIEIGKSEGARVAYGGSKPVGLDGFFVEPTIFTNCTDNMRIVQEEIFGPVMSILSFTSEAEVVDRANDTIYGLSAGVFSNDIQRCHRVIKNLQAGTCWINNYNLAPVELPWGGHKQSGIGRENGVEGIEAFTQAKSVYVEMNKVDCPYE